MSAQIPTIDIISTFSEAKKIWRDLWYKSDQSPFLHPDFLERWWFYFSDTQDQLNILIIYHADIPTALFPLYWHRRSNSLQWIGYQPGDADMVYCEYAQPVMALDQPSPERLFQSIPARARHLDCLRSTLSLPGALSVPRGVRYFLPTREGDYADYLARLRKSQREKLKRRRNKLRREAGFSVLSATAGEIDLDRAWSTLSHLHTLRWAGQSRNLFAQEKFCQFHQTLLRSWVPQGLADLRILVKDTDGQAIAAGYWFFSSAGQIYYQSGLSPQHAAAYSPLFVLHHQQIQECFETRRKGYDFMLGEKNSYKQDFGCITQDLHDFRLHFSRPANYCDRFKYQTKKVVKQLVHHFRR